MAKTEYIDERKCSGIDCAWCATLDCIHSVMARVRKEVEDNDTTSKDN